MTVRYTYTPKNPYKGNRIQKDRKVFQKALLSRPQNERAIINRMIGKMALTIMEGQGKYFKSYRAAYKDAVDVVSRMVYKKVIK